MKAWCLYAMVTATMTVVVISFNVNTKDLNVTVDFNVTESITDSVVNRLNVSTHELSAGSPTDASLLSSPEYVSSSFPSVSEESVPGDVNFTVPRTTQSVLSSNATLKTYLLGFLPSMTQGVGKEYAGAFVYALENENKKNKLAGFKLDYIWEDIKADTFRSIAAMTKQYINDSVAFVGPEDSCLDEAKIAGAWNLGMVAFKCGDSLLSHKLSYPTFSRTLPSTSKVSKSIISLMKHFNWKKFIMVVSNSTLWQEVARGLETKCRLNGVHITANKTIPEYLGLEHSEKENLRKIIEETQDKTRIYVFLGDHYALVDFVRIMQSRGYLDNGEYVIIAVRDKPYDSSRPKDYFFKTPFEDPKSLNDTDVQLKVNAFRSVLTFTLRLPNSGKYEAFKDTVREYNSRPPFNAPRLPAPRLPGLPSLKLPVPITAAYVYDAVTVLSRAIREQILNGSDPRDGRAVAHRIHSRTYTSIQGYEVYMDENGDPEGNYSVLGMKKELDGKFGWDVIQIGNFLYNKSANDSTGDLVFNRSGDHDWVSDSPPVDEPKCGFLGEKCRFKPDWPTGLGISITAIIILIAAVFVYRHYAYENKLARLLWKIDASEIKMTGTTQETANFEKLRKKSSIKWGFLNVTDNYSRNKSLVKKTIYTKIGLYKGTIVAIKQLPRKHVELTRSMKKELHLLKMNHDNINRFIGACVDPPQLWIVAQYCARGSLRDILSNKDIRLDEMFIASLVSDLTKGMCFLHDSDIVSHGNLKSTKCLVDSRWVLQICDFGLHNLRSNDMRYVSSEEKYYAKLLWRAPELLHFTNPPSRGTQKGDVYSFAIILHEIFGRCEPWGHPSYSNKEIINKVKFPEGDVIYRPSTVLLKCESFILKTMQECWAENPDDRPEFKNIRIKLRPLQEGLSVNIFDNMLAIMEKYATSLESLVTERTQELREEKKRTEILLHRMLPKSVAEQLKQGQYVIPEQYSSVTIYFSDIVGFTAISAASTPMQVVDMLNDIYTCFDSIIGSFDVYKIETIGDAYMVVSGLPIRNGDNHAGEIASMSLNLLEAMKTFRIKHRPSHSLKLRIGIHSGSCVAGVVGLKMPRYCLFGDTVNTASRMESTGIELKIHCSEQCKVLLDKLGGYNLEYRGLVSMKGKGEVPTYWLSGEDTEQRLRRLSEHTNPAYEHSDTDSGHSVMDEVHEVDEIDENCRLLPYVNGKVQCSKLQDTQDSYV